MRQRITLIILFTSFIVQAQQYQTTHFEKEKKLTEAFVYSIVQDNSGYLWIGTSNGLFRYNGFSFKYFTKSDSLADNFITSAINHNGKLWLGHKSGAFSVISETGIKKIKAPTKEAGSIAEFQEDANGFLWAATYSNGIYGIDAENIIKKYTFSESEITINTFRFTADNNVLLGSDDGLRYGKINANGTISILKHLVDIPKSKIAAIIKTANDEYYIATEDQGIFSLNITRSAFIVKLLVTPSELSDNIVSSLQIDKQLNLWVGTFGGGLLKVNLINTDNAETKELKWYSSETSDYIKCIFQDRDEIIWLGNFGAGITKFSLNPFEYTHQLEVGTGNSVLALAADSNTYWVGTDKALLHYNYSNELINIFNTGDGLPADEISALFVSRGGIVFAGTQNNGLFRLQPGTSRFSKFDISTGILENSITSINGNDSILWIGTRKGLAELNLTDESLKWYSIQNGGLPHNVVNHLYLDSEGKLWITTQSNTLSCYYQNSFKKIEIPSENGVFILNAVTKDREGNVWLGSNGMGVYKLKNDTILNLKEKEGLFSNYCYSIIADKKGYVWITHRGGISCINIKTLAIRSIQKYAEISSDDEFNVNACLVDNKSIISFGSNRGILKYYSTMENQNLLPPILNLLSLKANEKEVLIREKTKLPAGRYKLKFEFIGISLKEPEAVKYQYRLLGYDNEWSDISTETSAVFTNLNSGHYRFELNASSSDGIITKSPLTIELIIRKPLWAYWWFYLVFFIILMVLVVSYIKRREFILVQAKQKLEKRVIERTREIQLQKDEIVRQGEIINKKNLDITDSMKYARQIQSAIFPPEEILKEALSEYFLINKPKDIVSGDFCWYTRYDDKYVIALTDCTGHGVPGAIMSMLGITLFNEVVNNLGITNSAEIMVVLREKVISALNQHRKENPSYDGMNVGLCVIDNKKKTIQYSGAFHNLVYFHKNELKIIKAERSPIGYNLLGKPDFKNHEINYEHGDMFYLYSDGYPDQFGGANDKKFSNRRLLEMLSTIQSKAIDKQKLILERTLSDWMMDEEQTDDIIVLGFRL
jgi:ligand-binding sensor domain-containing protein/serine phosphatase RsbU (regulator of sigma subunit)